MVSIDAQCSSALSVRALGRYARALFFGRVREVEMRQWISVAAIVWAGAAGAAEGMWQPAQLPQLADQLQRAGLELPVDSLTDLTQHPMRAIVSLGGCSAAFVSPQGLIVTNHHCAYGGIQFNSTPERNLLAQGFLAKSTGEELPIEPTSRVFVTESIDDVTARVLEGIPAELEPRARFDRIDAKRKALVRACEQAAGYRCDVYTFHGGLSFQLIKQLEIRDVRLVYAPSESIGKYGGDVDNWMWPRHTGDFTFLRAYVAPNGAPRAFDKANVPFKPKSHLKVNASGLSEGDMVLLAGYPGRTQRKLIGSEVRQAAAWGLPTGIREYGAVIEKIEWAGNADPNVKLKYAGALASLNNTMKNFEGTLYGFRRADIVSDRLKAEAALTAWIKADPKRLTEYGDVIADLEALLEQQRRTVERDFYYDFPQRAVFQSASGGNGTAPTTLRPQLLTLAKNLYRLSLEREKPDADRELGFQQRDEVRIEGGLAAIDRRFDATLDQAIWAYRIGRYHTLPVGQRVASFDQAFGLKAGDPLPEDLNARLAALYAATKLTDAAARQALFKAKPAAFRASSDPFVVLALAVYDEELNLEEQRKTLDGRSTALRSRQMAAEIAFRASRGEVVYPDANSSLRVTYGRVTDVAPRDAVRNAPFTSLDGLLEKETGTAPFNSPAPLLSAIREQRFGPYAKAELNSVPVNFLADLDITGGNSGSATMNARGEFVGVVFDGNYEAISSNWAFNPKLTRSIHVDVRYMLWVMDTIDGADGLIKEMGLEPTM
jgi:hypothetical protein